MPWKLFSPNTPLFIQGMTGKEGSRLARWLLRSGTCVVGGVTPGKGGMIVEGQPIFDSVQAAREVFPSVDVSTIVVPAPHALEAVTEACRAGIKYMTLLTEGVPVHDVLAMRQVATEVGATVLGPSSVGYLQSPAFRTGFIGGENPWEHLLEGSVAVLSTSGGMVNELMMGLAREGIGIRAAFALGGDQIPTYAVAEALAVCEAWQEVETIVLFVEPGRPILRLLQGEIQPKKRFILFLVGDILDQLPRGQPYGHTGTLLHEDEGSVQVLRETLRVRGVCCVSTLEECIKACQ